MTIEIRAIDKLNGWELEEFEGMYWGLCGTPTHLFVLLPEFDCDEPMVVGYVVVSPEQGIDTMEIASTYQGRGLGEEVVELLREMFPALHISGEINSKGAARFWKKVGLLQGDTTILFDGRVVAI